MNALIGHTGFVGSNILEQKDFDFCYNSKNIEEIKGKEFDMVVCAATTAVKWKANKNPREDYQAITELIKCLDSIKFNKFVLVSTSSVYDNPADKGYGRNRLYLENHLRNNHHNVYIIRLPSLFGNHLRKNVLYDLLNKDYNYLPNISSTFQYYWLGDIWNDIKIVLDNKLEVVNFGTEPIEFRDVLKLFSLPAMEGGDLLERGNMVTEHAQYWGKDGSYLYNREEIIDNLIKYIEKENSIKTTSKSVI
jgi:nucleoside-diphosphate-sugar epimerase